MNAVWIDGEGIGPTLYYGAGAGAMPTASAVVADLIAIARGDALACCTGAKQQAVLPNERVVSAFYLRIPSRDAPGVFAEVAAVLGRHGISIEGAIQRQGAVRSGDGGESWVPIIILTAPVAEGAMAAALQQVQKCRKWWATSPASGGARAHLACIRQPRRKGLAISAFGALHLCGSS